jgi:DNA-binding NarL/FixJ family response regulator
MVWGLTHFIDSQKLPMEVAGTVSSRADLFQALRTHRPDVVLLEIQLEEERKGAELVRMVKENSSARVIVFTGTRDPEAHEKAVLAGAEGLILKSEPLDVIVRAVKAVHAGELWLKRDFTAKVVAVMVAAYRQATEPACSSQFTPSESRVIAAAVKYRGAPNKVIADALHMSPNTFRNHLSCIYMKLNIHRRLDLVLYGIKHGLAEPAAIEPAEDAGRKPAYRPGGLSGQTRLADAWRAAPEAPSPLAKAGQGIAAGLRTGQDAASALVGSQAQGPFPQARPLLPGATPTVQSSPVRLVRASLRPTGATTVSRR